MRRGMQALVVLLLMLTAGPAARERPGDPLTLSPRNANYRIEARLDSRRRIVTGREWLTWRNITNAPTSELRYHLYYNAFKNSRSTWLRERALAGRLSRPLASLDERDWGWTDVTVITTTAADGRQIDLMPGRRFVAPDDGNAEDQTVMAVPLPRAVAPGETITVYLEWTAQVPRTFSRTGAIGDFFFLGQWFPKVGVLQDGGWNCHQFHASTEFFSDYGIYDVKLTVPKGWVVGATGVEREVTGNPDATTTHRFYQEDVHDFAWTTSPHFIVRTARFEQAGLPPVEMRLLLQPEHAGQAERHFAATRAALRYYGQWYGPYPYPHITIVDPAWQSDADGMDTRRCSPPAPTGWRRPGSRAPKGSPSTSAATSSGTRWSATTSSRTPGWTRGSTPSPPAGRWRRRSRRTTRRCACWGGSCRSCSATSRSRATWTRTA